MKIFDVITIFPKAFSYLGESIMWRAQDKGFAKINVHNLRDYSKDKRRRVDGTTYGGGAGMVMQVDPIQNAVKTIKSKDKRTRVILLSAKGKIFNQKKAKSLLRYDQLIFICGRYEGVDERVAKYIADEEISIGEYVLTGGELPAMIIIDSIARLIPGVIKEESLKEESFSKEGFLEYSQYTKPEVVEIDGKKRRVPKVLLSGNHQRIKEWRNKRH
ncbi:tRNA (guanosine(37)-N1)-methyltransferase TrmD [Candidatus Azambacteria bacterium]|nr:tRNA (guanosine(37)-N1)-methyltransferase TrmD [Candidatus Azambacteria bacterium]